MTRPKKNRRRKSWAHRVALLVLTKCKSPKRARKWGEVLEGSIFNFLGLLALVVTPIPFLLYLWNDNPNVLLISAVSLLLYLITVLDRQRRMPLREAASQDLSPNVSKWLRIFGLIVLLFTTAYAKDLPASVRKIFAEVVATLTSIVMGSSPTPTIDNHTQHPPAPSVQKHPATGQIFFPDLEPEPKTPSSKKDSPKRKQVSEKRPDKKGEAPTSK